MNNDKVQNLGKAYEVHETAKANDSRIIRGGGGDCYNTGCSVSHSRFASKRVLGNLVPRTVNRVNCKDTQDVNNYSII